MARRGDGIYQRAYADCLTQESRRAARGVAAMRRFAWLSVCIVKEWS
jgi:hypothetical protein